MCVCVFEVVLQVNVCMMLLHNSRDKTTGAAVVAGVFACAFMYVCLCVFVCGYAGVCEQVCVCVR